MDVFQANDFSVPSTQGSLVKAPKPIPTTPAVFWAARRRLLSLGEIKLRQCKLGALRRLAGVWPLDIARA